MRNLNSAIPHLIITGFILSLVSGPSLASHDRHQRTVNGNLFYDYAKVTSVTPIVETIEHRIPRPCNHKTHYRKQQRSATPIVLGSIIGAAIGNKAGHHKSNQRVGAVVGGILGASIGSDISRKQAYGSHRCETSYDIQYEEQVVGYDVNYRYRGNNFHTQTNEHPGRKLQIKLRVEPLL